MEDLFGWIFGAIVALLLLCLAWTLFVCVLKGALVILAMASASGFVGLAVYISLWVFLFPVMAVLSLIAGIMMHKETS